MAERSAIPIFRIIAPEFKDVPDTEAEAMLELCEPLVSKRRFGRVYNQALALLAAHRLKLSGKGQDMIGGGLGTSGAAVGFGLASVSEGSTNVSFNTANMNPNDDSWYALTQYGMEYLNLRRLYIMSITSAGEA